MKNKQLKRLEIPKWGTYLRGRWRECFASHLTVEEQQAICMDNFLWHLCSWEKVTCLQQDGAIRAFLQQTKHKCTIFYQFIDDAYLFEHADTLTITDLPYIEDHMDYNDMYVMDWNNKWTFIMTHERECGPYFIQRK
ncbi:DUF4275 family protein [Niallia circulans]|uniref:DUF4275 family protein n=1 Tax=Niallia circulans TaxID=1397 RepID=A0A553SQA2_NIACI|nr:DUF4275 family protein [Niallia circulans]TRZ39147.1 DUF4275 family protein [Niallia circulans]